MFNQFKKSSTHCHNIKGTLYAAMKYALSTCIIGAPNKMVDIIKTNGWVFFSQFRYHNRGDYVKKNSDQLGFEDKTEFCFNDNHSLKLEIKNNKQWFYHIDDYQNSWQIMPYPIKKFIQFDPLHDPQFSLKKSHIGILLMSMVTMIKRTGACYERCCLIAKYLWENNNGINKVEIIFFNFDHCITIINREGELNEVNTWGNAWIIDSWYPQDGIIYSPKEFIYQTNLVKEFIEKDALKRRKLLELEQIAILEPQPISWICKDVIYPKIDKYPTYSLKPLKPIEYYYELLNAYPLSMTRDNKTIDDYLILHKNNFKDCLVQLKKYNKI